YAGWDTIPVRMSQVDSYGGMDVFAGVGAQDKFVTVENTGNSDAYVRTLVAIEIGTGNASLIGTSHHNTWTKNAIGTITINGNNYSLIEYLYKGAQLGDGSWRHENGVLPAGETTYPNLSQVYMKSTATNEDVTKLDGNGNGTIEILVFTQAVQVANFVNAEQGKTLAETALDTAFGDITVNNHPWVDGAKLPVLVEDAEALKAAFTEGADTILLSEGTYTFPASSLGEGDTLICEEGTVFEGTSSLNVKGATVVGATFKKVETTGDTGAVGGTVDGVFKNCTFVGNHALRWCYTNEGDTVVFENCVFDPTVRGIHFDEMNGDVIFRNCTISGFNAVSGKGKLTFENCTFTSGRTGYNGLNLYVNTVLTNCTFEFLSGKTNFIDYEAAGKTLTITNCVATLDGVAEEVIDFVGGSKISETEIIVDGVKVVK
ncbi:MAG: right-handed parallel beta-helix repeat-containing protein, partial [Oscillospiraceae bacterium]|nr:right-handed parallel beta-helix repeat-containing protein [Oscillospiraceae bacterium]